MKYRLLICSGILSLIVGCAGQRLPEGGPVDITPPEIVSVFPKPNTVNFSENSVLIEFSEYVDRRTAEEAVFISPAVEEKEIDWSGTEMEIIFHEELRKNTTYVITIGTDVMDIRARNRMASAFSLSFSTGDKIDNGTIIGKVYDDAPDGIMIFSYRLNEILPDTLNPSLTKPDYMTQTGSNGEFTLRNVAPGTYRLFAVKDEYRNFLYEPEIDVAGTSNDVTITTMDTIQSGLMYTIAKEDTTPPRILSVQPLNEHHLLVQFTEAIDSSTIRLHNITISDTLGEQRLPVRQYFPNNELYSVITVVTEKQKRDQRYILTVDSVRDVPGFVINASAKSKFFTGSEIQDTVPPTVISTNIKDPFTRIFPDEPIRFGFGKILFQPIADSAVILMQLKDSTIVPAKIVQNNLTSLLLVPNAPLSIGKKYSAQLRWNAILDIVGNRGPDSIFAFPFSVEDPENFGSIEGFFAGFPEEKTIVQAMNVADKKQEVRKERTGRSGKFSFQRLPEGRYALKAFEDLNNNGKHDPGKLFPYTRSEKFSFYRDTIRVRARWPVDGVIFKGE